MKKFFRPTGFLLMVLLFSCSSGCTPAIKTQVLMPARAHQAAALKRIAVLPFDGADQVQADLEAMLVSIQVEENRPFFDVLERSALDRIINEQSLGASGLIDVASAARIGQLAGVQAVITGRVDTDAGDTEFTETRSRRPATIARKKMLGQSEYEVNCTRRTAVYTFIPKIIDVNNGAIIASESFTGEARHSICDDSNRPLKSREELLREAKSKALDQFRPFIAPYYISAKLKLITSDDSGMSGDLKKDIQRGADWARQGRMDRAQEIWGQCYQKHRQGYALPYLMGLCAELSGDLNKAYELYIQADKQTGKPNRIISEAVERVRTRVRETRIIQEQLEKK